MFFSKQKTNYTSEATQFINDLKKANPKLEEQQREGRALLWDKAPASLDDKQRILDSTIQRSGH